MEWRRTANSVLTVLSQPRGDLQFLSSFEESHYIHSAGIVTSELDFEDDKCLQT
jgi:hypothetical protein